MRRSTLCLLIVCILLAACAGSGQTSLREQLKNPLVAARYGDELADRLANLFITDDPLVTQKGMKIEIQRQIERAKAVAREARKMQNQGMMGGLIPMKQFGQGEFLYAVDTLSFSSDFQTDPGPALHVYLTTAVDPRDVKFPDPTAIDLGEIQSAYGPQQYAVHRQKKPEQYRTVVLWDTMLNRLFAFAQLSKRAHSP